MPILSMDKKGNIVQTDSRFNGAVGVGAIAEMVDQSDVTELSLSPEDQKKIQKDREALRILQMKDQQAKVRKYAQDKLAQKKKEQARAAYLEKQYNQKKKENYLAQLYKNSAYMAASQKPGHETMSGVGGYGFSADGRQPMLSRASQDWQPILQANVAFGGDAENWGNDTGIGQHSNDEVKKHGFQGLGAVSHLRTQGEDRNEADTAVVLNDGMTPEDEMSLMLFDKGNYASDAYYHLPPHKKVGSDLWDDWRKSQVATRNNSTNHSSEMAKIAAQGWAYSILDNGEDDVQLVKVAYHWGLPVYVPDNHRNTYTKEYIAGYTPYSVYYGAIKSPQTQYAVLVRNGKIVKNTVWNQLRPIIEAAAKEYAAHSDEYGVWQGRDYSKLRQAKAIQKSVGGGGFFKKLFSQGNPDYTHPLIKQGLLK